MWLRKLIISSTYSKSSRSTKSKSSNSKNKNHNNNNKNKTTSTTYKLLSLVFYYMTIIITIMNSITLIGTLIRITTITTTITTSTDHCKSRSTSTKTITRTTTGTTTSFGSSTIDNNDTVNYTAVRHELLYSNTNSNTSTESTTNNNSTIKPITVIIMNHRRPELLLFNSHELLSTFIKHPYITKIIICHSNPITSFTNNHLIEYYNLLHQKSEQQSKQQSSSYKQKLRFTTSINNNTVTTTTTTNVSNHYLLFGTNIQDDNEQDIDNDNTPFTTSSTTTKINSKTQSNFIKLLQSKVQHINATKTNDMYGLALRFYYCSQQYADDNNNNNNPKDNDTDTDTDKSTILPYNDTNWVIHVDDDMDINSIAIDQLIISMIYNSKRIVGYHGRVYSYTKNLLQLGYGNVNTIYTNKIVEVVLTKLLIMEQVLCTEFINVKHLIEDTIVNQYTPIKWNGEDIFINLIANQYYYNNTSTSSTNSNNNNITISRHDYYNNYVHQLSRRDHINTNSGAYVGEIKLVTTFYNTISDIITRTSTSTSNVNHSLYPLLYQFIIHQSFYTPSSKIIVPVQSLSLSSVEHTRTTTSITKEAPRSATSTVSTSISGNSEKISIYNFYDYCIAYSKLIKHQRYRGYLWYNAKEQLIQYYSQKIMK